ncbi:MAG: riboflavin synthase [Burkholderiaceae bacterium]
MFTGIVAAKGRILSCTPLRDGRGRRLRVQAGSLALDDVALGDSIAIQGACMTVVELEPGHFGVDVSEESLAHTVGLDAPGEVNLEKAMRLADRVGGHLVTGHVDGVGRVRAFERIDESHLLRIEVPASLAHYVARKGSVTIDGVSLTINAVVDEASGCVIDINLIPHTVAVTTLQRLTAGDLVNLEIDLIARYLERLRLGAPADTGAGERG